MEVVGEGPRVVRRVEVKEGRGMPVVLAAPVVVLLVVVGVVVGGGIVLAKPPLLSGLVGIAGGVGRAPFGEITAAVA